MNADRLPGAFIGCVWLAWVLYWWGASGGTKTTQRSESRSSRLSHLAPLLMGATLIGTANVPPWTWLARRLLPGGFTTYWIGVSLLLAGLAFTIWARRHLARNWSATVTLKEGHELIRSGPYRWVRHPIYTGLLLAFIGSAISRGELRGLLGVLLILAAFVRKLRIEECWMRERFGENYEHYSADVPALIPRPYPRAK